MTDNNQWIQAEELVIHPHILQGKILVPPSKSMSHRSIIAAALGEGVSVLSQVLTSEDIQATIEAVIALGAQVNIQGVDDGNRTLRIKGIFHPDFKNSKINEGQPTSDSSMVDCRESGSTLRFMIPIFAALGKNAVFTGRGKLTERPLDPYYNLFQQEGIQYSNRNGKLPLAIEGQLQGGEYRIPGDISSQFITGLLFALPLLEQDSVIVVEGDLQSKDYVQMTLDVLKDFGIQVINKNHQEYFIKGNQVFQSKDYEVEGDFSQAAFWIMAGALGGPIEILGLHMQSSQGDREIIPLIQEMGAHLEYSEKSIIVSEGNLQGIHINGKNIPDILPVLSVAGALSQGETRIVSAERLRIKESDRIKAMVTELVNLGAEAIENPDGITLEGKETIGGGVVNTWNDHRIAMAMAVASIKARSPLVIQNPKVVTKSYPMFWEDFQSLGGRLDQLSNPIPDLERGSR